MRQFQSFLSVTIISVVALFSACDSFTPPRLSGLGRGSLSFADASYNTLYAESSAGSGNAGISFSDAAVMLSPRKCQVRRKSRNRRPKNYWTDPATVERELRHFWTNLNVTIQNEKPPPIPNEVLLNHFERHDLRAAIVMQGGRQALSFRLDGAPVMAGKWKEAVETSTELKQLLQQKQHGLSPDRPPLSPQQKKKSTKKRSRLKKNIDTGSKRRKPRRYWNMQKVIGELYVYLDECQENMGRPAVWMPRLSEIEACGRRDLKSAIVRRGGANKVCVIAKLIPYREWHYFEGQLELFIELRDYLDEYEGGNYEVFPSVSDMKRHGHHQLHRLIQHYGGRKFVAGRLSMKHTEKPVSTFTPKNQFHDLEWGKFSLDFGIRLLSHVRAEQMAKKPPLSNAAISMPSRAQLVASGPLGIQLDQEINEFGGYENVGRRLGLAIS